jgi:hypothetical protein
MPNSQVLAMGDRLFPNAKPVLTAFEAEVADDVFGGP